MISASDFKDSNSKKMNLSPTLKNITVLFKPGTGKVLVNVLPNQRNLTLDQFNSIYPKAEFVNKVESFLREQIELELKNLLN